RARRRGYLELVDSRASVRQMRLASMVVGAMLVAGAALAAPESHDPFPGAPRPTPAAAAAPPAPRAEPAAAAIDELQSKPKPKQISKRAARRAELKKLAAIKPEPNEFTNDPVLGNAARIRGQEVTSV